MDCLLLFVFFVKQKTAYELRMSDWSSDVCSSDIPHAKQGFSSPDFRKVQLGQRAAIYARVSTADQSCERQLPDLTGFAERGGYAVIEEIGRASCRERVCQYVLISVVAGSLKKKQYYKTVAAICYNKGT